MWSLGSRIPEPICIGGLQYSAATHGPCRLGFGSGVWDFPGQGDSDCYIHKYRTESKHVNMQLSCICIQEKVHVDFSNRFTRSPVVIFLRLHFVFSIVGWC